MCPKLYNSFPSIIKYFPGSHQTIFKNWGLLKCFVKEKIDKHKEDWNPSESRDFIDSYLQEIAKVSNADQTLLQRGLEIRRDEKQAQILQAACVAIYELRTGIRFRAPVSGTEVQGASSFCQNPWG